MKKIIILKKCFNADELGMGDCTVRDDAIQFMNEIEKMSVTSSSYSNGI
jgi:hypothetical protein